MCETCNRRLIVKYTYLRPAVTIHGRKTIRVKVMGCKIHKNERISIPDEKDTSLIPKCYADLKLTILIGLLRWRLGMKRFEIKSFLQMKGVSISEGAISYRSLDFLLLFKELHKSMNEKIKTYFDRRGGIILHIDGTHKSGGKVVFVLQEDFNNIVIDADLIPTEATEHINPLLSEFKEAYGSPLVVVRDMGKGLAQSATTIFPGSPQQICQIHFIRDLEKDMVTKYHKNVKSAIVKHKLTPKLKALRSNKRQFDGIIDLEERWVHIAVDYLLHPVEKHLKWISLPIAYFVQYHRVKEIYSYVKRLIRLNTSKNLFCTPLMDLEKCLKPVIDDPKASRFYNVLEKKLEWLDKLREQLRITRKNHLKDKPQDETDIETVKKDVRGILNSIHNEGKDLGGKYPKIASDINAAFDNHWDELFVPNPIVNGKKIHFKRHNNGLESNHRGTRKSIRERTGRSETNCEMEQFGDLLAIASNLWNKTYQETILDDVDNLCTALFPFVNNIPKLRKKYHDVRKGPEIPIHDSKRLNILENFLNVLESTEVQDTLISELQSILCVTNEAETTC